MCLLYFIMLMHVRYINFFICTYSVVWSAMEIVAIVLKLTVMELALKLILLYMYTALISTVVAVPLLLLLHANWRINMTGRLRYNSFCSYTCINIHRPISGIINFCPSNINDDEQVFQVAKHEVFHVLVS